MVEIIRMVVVLSAITGLAGFVLSGLKVVTDPIIEQQFVVGMGFTTLSIWVCNH